MKEINEKTFELNITNQLLNISKAYIYYMTKPFISNIMQEGQWFDFLQENSFFTQGLTQKQEADPQKGGYDVSINYKNKKGKTGRLLFLQYKSGNHSNYCRNTSSKFHGSTAKPNPHIVFLFNDGAAGTQHSTLRTLAGSPGIKPESVLYVFPRITEEIHFNDICDDLLQHSSFVPVLEIDRQGLAQKPPLAILDGVSHKYRTSYDGNNTEVNYYYYGFYYDQQIISKIISELVCIQFERILRDAKENKEYFGGDIKMFLESVVTRIQSNSGNLFRGIHIFEDLIIDYLKEVEVKNLLPDDLIIPKAPEFYTTEISENKIDLVFDHENDLSSINFQII